jgi:hypothetical protein
MVQTVIVTLLRLFQDPVDQQQVTEQMANVAIDDPADNWRQTETSQTDWNQQSESQTDWSQQTETQAEWNSSPGNQTDCKSGDIHTTKLTVRKLRLRAVPVCKEFLCTASIYTL